MNAVRIRGLTRRFGEVSVLDGLDLDIASGEFVALLGRSGSGKTTLLRTLAGLDPAEHGRVEAPEQRAVVFQEPRLLPWKPVWQNVALGLRRPDARQAALAALQEVELARRVDAWPLTLSGGEAQRAGVARALATAVTPRRTVCSSRRPHPSAHAGAGRRAVGAPRACGAAGHA
jgi:sulfonate transport system ATP-binding protein